MVRLEGTHWTLIKSLVSMDESDLMQTPGQKPNMTIVSSLRIYYS